MKCYIFDIDGTLADLTHRLHHVKTRPKNWPAFHAGCGDDAPFPHMQNLISRLWLTTDIVFMSGRNEANRKVTTDWLIKHGFAGPSLNPTIRLYMRADDDYRNDDIIKLELLQKLRDDGWEPVMAFDDRDRVVKMWRDNGIPCAQVAPGDF